jgi:hypothetical protein
MLGLSAICWVIWKNRNGICFERTFIKNPCEIICPACAFMRYWAGLYPEETQKMINAGVDSMMKTALKLLGKQGSESPKLAVKGKATKEGGRDEDPQADKNPGEK